MFKHKEADIETYDLNLYSVKRKRKPIAHQKSYDKSDSLEMSEDSENKDIQKMKVPKAVIRKKREIKVAENLPRYSIKENFADINSNILIALLLQASPKICNEFYKLLKNSEMKKEVAVVENDANKN
ncbi:hypothetical protein BB558_002935 [Smittium angustum]|uniref:Uncharacterized protein n=1 Tax=Smittium angustum TaxID=133377 RepID=A0A2U1J7P8_SMIAN|nr:hypothetical protein BB558_002935 [Smittium angustum]